MEVWVMTNFDDPMPPLAQRSLNEKGLPTAVSIFSFMSGSLYETFKSIFYFKDKSLDVYPEHNNLSTVKELI
jgi:hypothetical protein